MTTIHMDTQPQAPNGASLSQTQSPSKFDECERVRQRLDGLRKHHNESSDIYNRTQPIINEQIHEETLKYLKNGQVNGTKTKSQKPRAPKRQRNTSSNNSNNSTNTSQGIVQQQGHLQQSTLYPTPIQQQPMQQITLYPPRIQQPPMHIQTHSQHTHQMQPQQQQHFKYQTTSNMYQQSHQTNMQTQTQTQHQYQAQNQQQQQQQIYPQQQQMQPSSHVHPQQIEQSHFVSQQRGGQHVPLTSLPNDLDLTLQAGLECDIDSLIKHEMSVEGQLDFNHDLLLKLDNHYQY